MPAEPLYVKQITKDEFDLAEPIDTSRRPGVIGGTITKTFKTISRKKKGSIGGGVGGEVPEEGTNRYPER